MILFLKAHVAGYTKKDGTLVRPHEDRRPLPDHLKGKLWHVRNPGLASQQSVAKVRSADHTIEVAGYAEVNAMAHNDAAVADLSNEGRVLALGARLRSGGSIPIPAKGLVQAYVEAFLAARGLDMASVWTARPGEFLRIATPNGRTWIRRYAVDAGNDVWEAMHRGEDVSAWDVTISRQ